MNTRPYQRSYRAFTLVELLVVIAIIGILAALLLSAISVAKERAIRAKCLSNVHQITLASLNYALDNRDRFPSMTAPEQLPGLVSGPASEELILRYCSSRDVFYDPANPDLNKNWSWGYSESAGGTIEARLIGYLMTYPGVVWLKPENINKFATPQPTQVGATLLPVPVSSERALMTCWVASKISQDKTNADIRLTYDYVAPWGNPDPGLRALRTAHLKGRLPTGGNLGMLDGSARWRKFATMVPRTTPGWVATYWW